MSLNEKFGRGGSNVRKLDIPDKPDINMLQKLLSELSMATLGTQCDVSWRSAENTYMLSLSHSRQTTRANWKLSRGKGLQASVLWEYATNDVSLVNNVISEVIKQVNVTQSQIRIPAIHESGVSAEERRAVNINSNLSGKLRKLFIGTQEDLIAGTRPSSIPAAKAKTPARSIMEQIDLTPGRKLLQHLFVGQFGIFSYPTFLFFLEREYYEAIENNTPLTLVVFKAIQSTAINKYDALPPAVLQEIAKRITHTQRKTDILAEYDQNTFAVLLPDTNNIGGKSFVHRVEKALFKSTLMAGMNENPIKFAFGVTTLADHCKTLPAILSFAKKTLEKAQKLGIEIVSDQDIIAEPDFKLQEYTGKPIDLTQTRRLMTELISGGIFTYSAFLAFLEHEYYRSARKKRDLLIMLLKIRVYEETFDNAANQLPPPAFYEVMRRVGTLLGKRDIFAHYSNANFVIMRSNTSVAQMQSFAKRTTQSLMSEAWLTPECPSKSLRIRTEICTVRSHENDSNLFDLIAVS